MTKILIDEAVESLLAEYDMVNSAFAKDLRQALADAALDKMADNARELGLSYEQPDRQATQDHAILNVLLNHCGKGLTPDVIDAIRSELQQEMRHGPCAWAFRDTTPPAPAQEPSAEQLRQIINGLERCHVPGSKSEFLRVWIRDWTAHKLSKAAPPAPAQEPLPPEWYARWIRNNYQDHLNIATLCEEMTKAAHGITKGE